MPELLETFPKWIEDECFPRIEKATVPFYGVQDDQIKLDRTGVLYTVAGHRRRGLFMEAALAGPRTGLAGPGLEDIFSLSPGPLPRRDGRFDSSGGETEKGAMNRDAIRRKYAEALNGLAGNTRKLFGYDKPVLIEGGNYRGIWLECGPLEGRVYGRHAPDIAKSNHEVFFRLQMEDGYLPCCVQGDRLGTSQIQMVVPIAATALETADLTGDEAFLAQAYDACSRWDHWLSRHRNTRGAGLCEAFCEYDTGHDNSPRFSGLPKKCPEDDASICPKAGKLPYLAPDLSATVYGGRRALAQMAQRLGKHDEAETWQEKGEELRQRIIECCYDPEDECFYDVDADGDFVRIRGDALTRVLGEHVVDQSLFERIYAKHIKSPEGFWPPYPLPSIAVSDPSFVRELPPNSWGGASQALTALRAPRWLEHYGKSADLKYLMRRWLKAILAAPAFMQQMNPWTGEFSTSEGYSPAMCVFIDFVDRSEVLADGQGARADSDPAP